MSQPTLPSPILLLPLRMPASFLRSRDAVTKTTRDDTRALLDFFNENEPASPGSIPNVVHQRAQTLGGLSLEKAKVRLGLFKSKKRVKKDGKSSLRVSTPPPGTVAITRTLGYACLLPFYSFLYSPQSPFSETPFI